MDHLRGRRVAWPCLVVARTVSDVDILVPSFVK